MAAEANPESYKEVILFLATAGVLVPVFCVRMIRRWETYAKDAGVIYDDEANGNNILDVVVYATGTAVVNAIGAFWIRLVAILTYVS